MWEGRGSTALALELRLSCISWPILYWVKFIDLAAISSWVCVSGSRLSDSRMRHQHQYAEPPTGHMSVIWPGPPFVCSFLKYTILTLPDCILYWLLKSGAVAWTLLTHWGQACFSVLGHSLSRCWLDVTMRTVNRATYTYWNHIYFC